MARADNEATQQRLGEIINSSEIDRLGEVFADDVVDHDPAPVQGPGVEGFKDFFRVLKGAFPDAKVDPELLVADDEHVSIAYTLTGTHEGEFQGVAPTGREISVRGVQIARFRDGKIVERWGSTDELGIMSQIGAEPQPA